MTASLVAALAKVVHKAAAVREKAWTCPKCSKPMAIGHIMFFGIKIADVCRFCPHVEERK